MPVNGSDVSLPDASVFDLQGGLAACGGSAELLGELAMMFEQEWPNRRGTLQTALDAGDVTLLGRTAHTLKGTFGALGSTIAAQAALEVDLRAKQGILPADSGKALLLVGDDLVTALKQWRAASGLPAAGA
jgi:HPt (histidine-containing phosphotransfer) domain-containing protein